MSARFVLGKLAASLATLIFVVVFNFFLFRVVAGDPVATLFRGRNLSEGQREELRQQFGLDGSKLDQFWAYLQQTAQLNFGRSYTSNEPVMAEIASRAWPTILLVGVAAVLSAVIGVLLGIVAAWNRGRKSDYAATSFTMTTYSMPDFWLGMLLLVGFARHARLVPDRRLHRSRGPRRRDRSRPGRAAAPVLTSAHADPCLPG